MESSVHHVASHANPTVSVIGNASVRTEPDEAFVFITLAWTDRAPGPALTEVAARGDALARLLDDLNVLKEDRSTSGITVNEEFDHTKDGRKDLGYRAATTVSVRLADRDLIGTIVMRCTQELDARIAGPSWQVSPDNPAWLEAAADAAANARAKAEAYAGGVGMRLGAVRTLAEPTDRMPPMRRARAAAGGDMHIETGDQEVTATVHATFDLMPSA